MKLQLSKNSWIPHRPDVTTMQNYQYRIGLILRLGGEWKKEKRKRKKKKKLNYKLNYLINIYFKVLLKKNSNTLFPTT